MSCYTLQNTNWTCDQNFFCYLLSNRDPFPVLPFSVPMIVRDSGGVSRGIWIVSRQAGWAPLSYVTFKNGLTGRNLPRELGRSVGYETLCSRKVRLCCSGLECCSSTEALQHFLQLCETRSPVGLQNPKLKEGLLGFKTLSPQKECWVAQPQTLKKDCWVAKP